MGRTVEYVAIDNPQIPAGQRFRIDPEFVVRSWVQYTKRIPSFVAVGMAERETGFTLNERDTEETGYVTDGIFQINWKEAVLALRPGANLFSLDDSCAVLATILERNLDKIIDVAQSAAAQGLGKSPTDENGAIISDVWAYLALSHNLGLGSASNENPGGAGVLPGIAHFGLDWPTSFQRAHPSMLKQLAYGDAALSGGSGWRQEFATIEPPENAGTGYGVRSIVLLAAVTGAALWALGGAKL